MGWVKLTRSRRKPGLRILPPVKRSKYYQRRRKGKKQQLPCELQTFSFSDVSLGSGTTVTSINNFYPSHHMFDADPLNRITSEPIEGHRISNKIFVKHIVYNLQFSGSAFDEVRYIRIFAIGGLGMPPPPFTPDINTKLDLFWRVNSKCMMVNVLNRSRYDIIYDKTFKVNPGENQGDAIATYIKKLKIPLNRHVSYNFTSQVKNDRDRIFLFAIPWSSAKNNNTEVCKLNFVYRVYFRNI